MNWNGSTTEWTEDSNWDGGVPGAGDSALLDRTWNFMPAVELSDNWLIDTLEIDNDFDGAWGLTIKSGGSLNVYSWTTLYDWASLIIEAGASFATSYLTLGATSTISNSGTLSLYDTTVLNGTLENLGILNISGTVTGNLAQDDFVATRRSSASAASAMPVPSRSPAI